MIRIIKKVLAALGWLTLTGVLLTTLFVLWGNKKGWEFDVVLSGSMEPAIKVGGLVVIRPVDTETLKVGDVISFRVPDANTPICHRIADISYVKGIKYFKTKGDANEEPDQFLTPTSDVNGKSVFYIPSVGRFLVVKNLGTTKISILGRSMPVAVPVITAMGLMFIGLMLKDTIESLFWPGRTWQGEASLKRKKLLARRRKVFHVN